MSHARHPCVSGFLPAHRRAHDRKGLDRREPDPSPGADEQLADERALLGASAKDLDHGARGAGPTLRAARSTPRLALLGALSHSTIWSRSRASDWSRRSTASTPSADRLLDLRRPHHPRRRPFPRPWLVDPRAARGSGADPQGRKGLAELPSRLGRAPTVDDIAERLGVSAEQCWRRCTLRRAITPSLDASPTMGDGEEPAPLRERIGSVDIGFETVEYGAAIEGAPPRSRARPRDFAPAFRRGPDPERDRRAGGRLPDARLADPPPTLETLRGAVSRTRTKPPTAGSGRRPRTRRTRRCCRRAPCRSSPQCCRPASSACQSRRISI